MGTMLHFPAQSPDLKQLQVIRRAWSRFLSGICYDIRQHAMGIQGYSDILANNIPIAISKIAEQLCRCR
jgi:hypothetical protein